MAEVGSMEVRLKELRKSGGRAALGIQTKPVDPEILEYSFTQCLMPRLSVSREGIQ